MKKYTVPSLCLLSFLFLINTGMPEPSEHIIYSGTLETQTGNVFTIDNIRINKFKISRQEDGVNAYVKPAQVMIQSGNKELVYNYSPEKLLVSPLHLSEIKKITVHSPDVTWTFNYIDKDGKPKKLDLMLINVEKQTGSLELLIDPNMTIWFDILEAGRKESNNTKAADDRITFSGVKMLTFNKPYQKSCPTNINTMRSAQPEDKKEEPDTQKQMWEVEHTPEENVEIKEVVVQEMPEKKISACPTQPE